VTAVADTTITAGVKAKLATDSDLKTLDVSVETTSGRATLRGKAPNSAARARATQLAASAQEHPASRHGIRVGARHTSSRG
jgi:osmotically-inducible protein OsmY